MCAKLHNFVIDQQQLEQTRNNNGDAVDDDNDDDNDDTLQIIGRIGAPMGMQHFPMMILFLHMVYPCNVRLLLKR